VRDTVDLNEFVNTLEQVTRQHDVPVTCNRIVPVANETERARIGITHPQYNAFHVTAGPFEGWALAYCKGPDGEQLEFAQAVKKAKQEFAEAAAEYMSSRA
jgi:predicted lipoprotein